MVSRMRRSPAPGLALTARACCCLLACTVSFVLASMGIPGTVLWPMPAVAAPGDPTTLTTNAVPPNSVSITQGSAGQPSLIAPQLLILGVPNDTTNLFPTNPINSVTYSLGGTGSSAFATAGTFGLKLPAIPGTGFFG